MNLHNFNSNTKSWKMYTNTLTSISGDDLLVAPSYGKDLILEVSANNDIFFKKGGITKKFDNLISDYLDMSFVREVSFNSLNSQVEYILQEISGSSVLNLITSGISNDLLIKSYDGQDIILEVSGNSEIIFKRGDMSYNLDDLIGGGGSSQSSDYATYNILDITGKIIFTDNSNSQQKNSSGGGSYSSSSNIVLTSISGNIIPSINNTFKLGDVSKNWSNAYITDLSVSNINGQPYIASTKFLIDYSNSTFSPFGQDLSGETIFNYFGGYVSLSEDGKIMGVTAPINNGAGTLRGSAQIYKYNDISWVQLGLDIDGEADNDRDFTLKLSKDGTIAAIGSFFNAGKGQVRIFKYNDISWIRLGLDIEGVGSGDMFARSISLSSNGKIIAIGAIDNDTSYNNAGQVRVFSYIENDNSWNKIGEFNGFDINSRTGASVSLSSSGTSLAISSTSISPIQGQVNVYDYSNNTWTPRGAPIFGNGLNTAILHNSKNFGNNIELSSDGSILAIAERQNPLNNNCGRVMVYKYNSIDNSWNKLGSDINGTTITYFEWDDPNITLSSDGTIIAVGFASHDSNRGLVRLYKFANNDWIKVGSDLLGDNTSDIFGYSVSLSSNGSILAVGAPAYAPSFTGRVRTYNVNYSYNSVLEYYQFTNVKANNIEVSGNIVPLLDLKSSLGSSLKRWGNAYISDISATNIDVSGNLNPLIANSSSLGSRVKSWGNAYIRDVSVTNIDVSGKLNVAGATKLSNTLEISGNVTFGGSTLYVPSSFTIDPNGHGDNTGTLLINGNLVVQGVTTTINSSIVDISDKMIVLASNASNSLQSDGAGFEISGAKVNLLYNNSSNTFRSSIGISISGNVVPVSNSVGSLGESGKIWDIAYVRELNVTNFTNSIDGAKIASGTISSTQIADGTIINSDISSSAAIAFSKINASLAITDSHISASAAISGSKIANATITGAQIANTTITATQIANTTITASQIANATITAAQIANTTITGTQIANTTITATQIANATITGTQIANTSITSDKINQANNWTFSQLISTSANIRDISATNIEVSGNIVPLRDLSSNLGSSLKRWRNVFVDDLSVNKINGQAYSSGGSSTVLTSVTSNIIPSTNNTFTLGGVSTNWNNAYISNITTSNIDVSNVVSIVKNNNQFVILGKIIDVSAVTDFGYQIAETVSLNDAGTIVAIGLPFNTANGATSSGIVIVYELNSDGIWIQKGQTLNGAQNDLFGWSVSLNDVGTRLAVGSPNYGNGNGVVKVYNFSGTTWTQLGGLMVGTGGQAGRSVSLNSTGNIVAFGEPYLDNYNAGSGSGSVGQGVVRVFQYNGSAWVQYGNNITALNTAFPNTYNQQGLGLSISLNSSGTRVAIGAVQGDTNSATATYGPGHVLVFDLISSTWTQVGQKLAGNSRDEIGSSCSLNATGNIVACGGRKTYPDGTGIGYGGVVRVYIQSGSTWILRGSPIYGEANYDYAGTSVSLNNAGTILAIGGPRNDANGADTGHVRVYQYIDASSNWYQMGIDIDGRALPSLYYGRAVSLNAAGNRLAIGGVSSTSSSYTAVTEFKDYVNVGMTVFNSNIAPFTHNTCTLGTNLLRWNNIYTQALTNASDDRLKHNEVIINNGLDVIDQLTPKFYQKTDIMLDAHYNGDLTGYTWNYEAGLIAQELLQISDLSFVVSDGDRYGPLNNLIAEPYSVNYNNIFVYGLAAIKELHAKVKAQETSILSLQTAMLEQQTTINSLLTRLQALETSAN